jgi:NTE family protein
MQFVADRGNCLETDTQSGLIETGENKLEKKIAFVLSGGGNRGALEVGIILALLEHGIRPHILVGTSVGAINAAAIAYNPTLEGARWLTELWHGIKRETVMPANYFSMVWRFITGESGLCTNQNLRNLLESCFPEGVYSFADIKEAELYITAVDLNTGRLHVFGIDRSESVLDAIMASCAVPVLLSPWQYRGRQYVDGAVASDLPVRIAVEMNATEIYAIDVGQRRSRKSSLRGIFGIIGQTLRAVGNKQVEAELGWARKESEADIHYIKAEMFEGLRIWDFSHTAEMMEAGRKVAWEYLKGHGLS